jgi:hypothetical protein
MNSRNGIAISLFFSSCRKSPPSLTCNLGSAAVPGPEVPNYPANELNSHFRGAAANHVSQPTLSIPFSAPAAAICFYNPPVTSIVRR